MGVLGLEEKGGNEPVDTGVDKGLADSADTEQGPAVSGDPTQALLTALGKFQRQMTDAQSETSNELWADECMNQLIVAVDIALSQNWSSMVEALTDSGRILQTYQSADRAPDCVPFLNDSYEILCLMVGDLIVDNESTALSDNWRRLYQGAVRALEETGLVLARDDDEAPETAIETVADKGEYEILLSVEGATADTGSTTVTDATDISEELPALDDLPSLDSVLEDSAGLMATTAPPGAVPSPPEAPQVKDAAQELDLVSNADALQEMPPAAPEPPTPDSDESVPVDVLQTLQGVAPQPDVLEIDAAEPPPIPEARAATEELGAGEELNPSPPSPEGVSNDTLVEILDTLCEHLDAVQKSEGEERGLAVDRFEGGLKALTREADKSGHFIAGSLCGLMREVCKLATIGSGTWDDRVIDLGYAFCGVYMDAATNEDSDNIPGWQRECEALIESLNSAPPPAPAVEEILIDPPADPLAVDSGIEDLSIAEVPVPPSSPRREEILIGPSPDPLGADSGIEDFSTAEVPVPPPSPQVEEISIGPPTDLLGADLGGEDLGISGADVLPPPAPVVEEISIEPPPMPVVEEISIEAPTDPLGTDLGISESPPAPSDVKENSIESLGSISENDAASVEMVEPAIDQVAEPVAQAATPAHEVAPPAERTRPAESQAPPPVEGSAGALVQESPQAVETAPPVSDPSTDADEYGQLLASARNAATKGDSAGAKYYALQAAAFIARSEHEKTTENLSVCEESLKRSWDMTEDARNEVEKAEGDVRQAATEVVSGESALGEANEEVAKIVQEVDDIQASIDDLDRQISDLQAKRDAEAEGLETTTGRMRQAEEVARGAEDTLQDSNTREQETRAYLESCRRNVKEKQRQTADMEAEMADSRELLAQREQSCDEIEKTIKQVCGDERPPDSSDTMLF